MFPIDAEPIDFDLITFTDAQTMLVQLGRTGMIAVFDDSCAALNRVMWVVEKITGPVSIFQARDLAAHFAMANLDLLNRPRFWTRISPNHTDVVIGGTTESVPLFRSYDQALFGSLISAAIPVLPAVTGMDAEQARAALLAGDMNFLFDEHGGFVAGHAARSKLGTKREPDAAA